MDNSIICLDASDYVDVFLWDFSTYFVPRELKNKRTRDEREKTSRSDLKKKKKSIFYHRLYCQVNHDFYFPARCGAKYFPGFLAKFSIFYLSSFHVYRLRQCSPVQIKYVSFADKLLVLIPAESHLHSWEPPFLAETYFFIGYQFMFLLFLASCVFNFLIFSL